MIRLILTVSLCSERNLTNDFIQGFSAPPGVLSLSTSASVTNALSGTPRSAAADFVRRNSGSGISIVVFTSPILSLRLVVGQAILPAAAFQPAASGPPRGFASVSAG